MDENKTQCCTSILKIRDLILKQGTRSILHRYTFIAAKSIWFDLHSTNSAHFTDFDLKLNVVAERHPQYIFWEQKDCARSTFKSLPLTTWRQLC